VTELDIIASEAKHYIGVTWSKSKQMWYAHLNGKYLGCSRTQEGARALRNDAYDRMDGTLPPLKVVKHKLTELDKAAARTKRCKGVTWDKRGQKWVVYLGSKYIGFSTDKREAKQLRKEAELKRRVDYLRRFKNGKA